MPRSSRPSATPVTAGDRRQFEAFRDATTLQLLFKAARLANERALARVASQPGAPRLRAAHTALLPHLDFDGVRLTDLADKVGVSKQAVGQLVDDLAEMGMVERVPDASDGRAKNIRFSRRGHAALMHGLGVLREIEAELGVAIEAWRMRVLRTTLQRLIAALEDAPRSGP